MVDYNTGSESIEFGDLGSKVMVMVTENVCKNDEKKLAKNSNLDIFEITSHHSIENLIVVILKPNMTILHNKQFQQEAFRERRHLHICDLVVWPWPFVKVKKANVIRCLLLYFTLVPGMRSTGLLLYEISPFVYFIWPLTFTCDLHRLSRSLSRSYIYTYFMLLNVCTKIEVCRLSRIWNMDICI